MMKLESREDPIRDATKLFWEFCSNSSSPEDLAQWLARRKASYPYDNPDAGYIDPEIKEIMLRGFDDPDGLVSTIVERLGLLTKAYRPVYHPDEEQDLTSLYTFAHLQGARLAYLRRAQGLSDDTRSALQEGLDAINEYRAAKRRQGMEYAGFAHKVLLSPDFLGN